MPCHAMPCHTKHAEMRAIRAGASATRHSRIERHGGTVNYTPSPFGLDRCQSRHSRFRQRKIKLLLFAGISMQSTSSSPSRFAASTTSLRFRTPHSGFRDFRLRSKFLSKRIKAKQSEPIPGNQRKKARKKERNKQKRANDSHRCVHE